jgi:hypothetical protein
MKTPKVDGPALMTQNLKATRHMSTRPGGNGFDMLAAEVGQH